MKNDGGPAFPEAPSIFSDDGTISVATSGMTLRDYFAAKAMQTLLQRDYDGSVCPGVAIDAYAMSDAMLKAREE
jgi:hypothetical protein